ncbi:YIL067C [Zygosaccharomyces parabailii]|nr:YIL067C [Zygosaccharomyces parabailii]
MVSGMYKRLDSNNPEMEEESFLLDELSSQAASHSTTLREADENWVMPDTSNFVKKFLLKLWYGPREAIDEYPSYPSKLKLLKFIDEFPDKYFRYYICGKLFRGLIFFFYCSIWFGVVFSLLYPYLVQPPYFYSKKGTAGVPIVPMSCLSMLNWEGTNNACGKDATYCEPFDHKEYILRCPALCDVDGWTYAAIAVGDQRIKYRGYQIGGGEHLENDVLSYPYRADSFPCSAAVHAGVVSPWWGGCTRVSMEGSQNSFPSKGGKYKTGLSIAFDSFFPSSFSFRELRDGIATGCYDPRIPLLIINIIFGLPVLYFTRGIVGYWVITIVSYWTVLLALDPPMLANPHEPVSVAELLSVGFQRLLPLCFVLYVVWKCTVKRTFDNGSPLTKIILWYPTFWSGVMNNITYDRLPVDRLTIRDLKEQTGAVTAVGSILLTILIGAIIQGYSLWKSGRFRKYFLLYILIVASLFFLQAIPGLNLRVHHYILGILLVPGCATRGASAYLFQGILIGLIISGVSRWDFASIVETDIHLLRGEAGALLKPPTFSFNSSEPHAISWILNSTLGHTKGAEKIDGYSLLLNDFEVYVGRNTTVDIDQLLADDLNISRLLNQSMSTADNDIKLYFRLARASTKNPTKHRGDYTNAGILEWPNGIWHDPVPGVS